MIPPRLRDLLIRCGISDVVARRGPNRGMRRVTMDRGTTHTANYRATDLRALERKGLIRFERLESMSELWGCLWFEVELTDEGKEEIADEYARRCAEADAENAKLIVEPSVVDDVDESRSDAQARAEARARQRAARS